MARLLYLAAVLSGGVPIGGIEVDQDTGIVYIPLLDTTFPFVPDPNVAEGAQASVNDGDTIPHTLAHTPNVIHLTGTVAGESVTYSSVDGTNITVAIKKLQAGAWVAGTAQTVSWRAVYQP